MSEGTAVSFSRGSSQPSGRIRGYCGFCVGRWSLHCWAAWEALTLLCIEWGTHRAENKREHANTVNNRECVCDTLNKMHTPIHQMVIEPILFPSPHTHPCPPYTNTWRFASLGKKCGIPAFFFFSFIYISWRLITLQYCRGFCHTLAWIGHGFTCVPHPDPHSHLPLHPIPLGLPSAPAPSTCLMHPTWADDLFHTW